MPCNLVYPYGMSQTFKYETLLVSLSNDNFVATRGTRSNLLTFLGYTRRYDSDEGLGRRSFRSNLGTDYWEGPSFRESLIFEWNLQLLTIEQCDTLLAMAQLQRQSLDSIRLFDERLVTTEAGARSRAKTSTPIVDAPTLAGINYYWGQYDMELIVEPASFVPQGMNRSTGARAFKCKFAGREHDLVPTSQDI